MKSFNSIILLGPTASGKTKLAAQLAYLKSGAVLSFDSRQVYRKLNIGSGKDLSEFQFIDHVVPHHLIDVCDIETNFHSYEFIKHYISAFDTCIEQKLLPILCGGTGLYFDLALKKHQYINIPRNAELRETLESFNLSWLVEKLESYDPLYTSQADRTTQKRLIRAIEIADYCSKNIIQEIPYPKIEPIIFGIKLSTVERNNRIDDRLAERLKNGLIEEVENLLTSGVSPERLVFLGLEYKYVTEYILGKLSEAQMIIQLKTAIHQYAKRQMTWFRKMEREGNQINWIDGMLDTEAQVQEVLHLLYN